MGGEGPGAGGPRGPRRAACRQAALLLAALVVAPLCRALPQSAAPADTSAVLGAACARDADCRPIARAACDDTERKCTCPRDYPIPHTDACLPVVGVDGNCTVSEQCRRAVSGAECSRDAVCACAHGYYKHTYSDGAKRCLLTETGEEENKLPVDPIMIGILVSLVLMFLIICVVLQLFSKARFRQNRTVLNSANPRLMNTSFFKAGDGGKVAGRRGSGVQRPRGSQASIVTTGVGSTAVDHDDDDDSARLERRSTDSDWRHAAAPAAGGTPLPKLTLPPLRTSGKQTPADIEDGKDRDRDSVVKQMKIEVAENGE